LLRFVRCLAIRCGPHQTAFSSLKHSEIAIWQDKVPKSCGEGSVFGRVLYLSGMGRSSVLCPIRCDPARVRGAHRRKLAVCTCLRWWGTRTRAEIDLRRGGGALLRRLDRVAHPAWCAHKLWSSPTNRWPSPAIVGCGGKPPFSENDGNTAPSLVVRPTNRCLAIPALSPARVRFEWRFPWSIPFPPRTPPPPLGRLCSPASSVL